MSSPGGYEDTTTQQQSSLTQQEVIGENMNPQQTGLPTFIPTTIQLNESKTQSLNVKINTELSGWVIGTTVDQNAQVYVLEESNNKVTRKKVAQKIQGVGGQVTNNEFNITLSEIESFYLDGVPRIEGKTQIDIIFTVYAYKGAESPVKQQFPFRIWYTLPNQNQLPIEKQYIKGMIPHHSMAILMSKRLKDKKISNEELKDLVYSNEKFLNNNEKFKKYFKGININDFKNYKFPKNDSEKTKEEQYIDEIISKRILQHLKRYFYESNGKTIKKKKKYRINKSMKRTDKQMDKLY
jgi:hypothetical protein